MTSDLVLANEVNAALRNKEEDDLRLFLPFIKLLLVCVQHYVRQRIVRADKYAILHALAVSKFRYIFVGWTVLLAIDHWHGLSCFYAIHTFAL